MAGKQPGLAARPMRRAVQALTGRSLPGRGGEVAENVIATKLALAALPVVIGPLVILLIVAVLVVGVIGGVAGEAHAEGCGGGSNGAAPVGLNGPPKNLIPIYQDASTAEGLNPEGPAILAGINRVETNFGENMGPSSAGAIGWMQFEPSTWKEYGEGGNPEDPKDAIFAAARLLKADGAPGNWQQAIFGYNHATWYVEEVEKYAHEYSSQVPPLTPRGAHPVEGAAGPETATPESTPETVELTACLTSSESGLESTVPGQVAKLLPNGLVEAPAAAPQPVKSMIAAGNQIAGLPYVWGGHHAPSPPSTGYDCSSAASFVMNAAGLLPPGTAGFKGADFYTAFVAANFESGGSVGLVPGPGKWVTVYTNPTPSVPAEHVYMTIAGVRFDDSSHLRNGTGPNGTNISMWQPPINQSGFVESHPKGL
jgi:transglycosylase-like protein with SLT domain